MLEFTGERIVPEADNCEPTFADKMYQEHLARYLFASQWVHSKKVLDVGCGVGYGSKILAEAGAAYVTAFDIKAEVIEHAKIVYHHPAVEFSLASATDFDFGIQYDVITCFELIEHVDQQEAVIECIFNALHDNGVLIISTPRTLAQKRTHFHTHEFSLTEFRTLLERRFGDIKFYFENNHFASLISDVKPVTLSNILTLKEQFTLEQADYFIAVASKQPAIQVQAQPILVLNNDRYVTLLERDITILHKAEDDLRDMLAIRQDEIKQLHRQLCQQVETEKSEIKQLHEQLSQLKSERDQARRETEQLCQQIETEKSEINYLKHIIAQMTSSTSWKMTAPYRAIGRYMKYIGRILAKIIQYRRDHGTRALVGAIKRRLNSRSSTFTSRQHFSMGTPATQFGSRQLSETYDLIMAIGCWEGESKRYRVYNIAEGLTAMGYSVLTIPYSEVAKIVRQELKASAIVLFRAPYDPIIGIDEVLSYAKARGIKVVFDVDDLVFEPDIVDQVDGFCLLNNSQKAQYLDGVQKYRQLLLRADLVTVPTEYLRRQVETLSKPCAVVSNSINYTQLSIAKDLAQQSREIQPLIRIGYFSGSHTHNKDFEQCEQALLDIMLAYPNTILRIVGHLDPKVCWDQFSDRIERIKFQPYQVMMHLLGGIDINIAPLEIDNPFCQSKSELKFFEAALLGIPTIASATDAYVAAIEQGVSGFYARNRDDWFSALEKLVDSAALRREMGARAKISALERFGIDTVARIAAMTFGLKPTQATTVPRSTATESIPLSRKLRIAWIIPGLIIGGGGHRNILRAAYFLQQFGHQITLYFIGTEQDPIDLKQLINKHFYPIDCPVFLYNDIIQPADVVFATHWSTVSAVLQNRNLVQEVMYFVQDFEPAFAPMGTEYVLAENTYRQGLYHITSGPWCEVTLRRDFQADADHFQFPVDRSIYYPRSRHYERRNLIYFAKPEMPRRCFELGLIALRELHKLCPDIEIILFGSPQAGKQRYDFPVTLRDIVPTLDDLAVLYSNGDIGMVFSTTNPSLIPYEMMACGLPVVDLRRANNEINYSNRFDIALLANPLPEKMAIEIAALLADPYELKARRNAGLEFINSFPSEEEMARRIESLILKRLSQKIEHNV